MVETVLPVRLNVKISGRFPVETRRAGRLKEAEIVLPFKTLPANQFRLDEILRIDSSCLAKSSTADPPFHVERIYVGWRTGGIEI